MSENLIAVLAIVGIVAIALTGFVVTVALVIYFIERKTEIDLNSTLGGFFVSKIMSWNILTSEIIRKD